MSSEKSYYRNFVTMFSGNVVSQIIPILIAPILARLFSPDDFAIYSNFLAIAGMMGIVAAGRLELAIPITKSKKEAQDVVISGLLITLALAVLSLVFPLFSGFFGQLYDSRELEKFLIYVPIAVLTFGALGVTTNWVLKFKKYNAISFSKIGQSLVGNALSALFGYAGWGIEGLIYGWFAGQVIGTLVLLLFMDFPTEKPNYTITSFKTTVREYKDFPLINSLHAFTDIFATQFLLFWIITFSFGLTELGLFAMMFKYVRAPISLVTTSVSQIFFAEVSSAISRNESPVPILKKTLSTSVAFSIPFILVIFLLGPELFEWYLGEEWRLSGVYAKMISPMLFLLFVLSPISSIPILMNKQRKAYLFAFIGYVLTLSSFWLAAYLELTFERALLVYSLVFAAFQLFYLYWMYSLIKVAHARSH